MRCQPLLLLTQSPRAGAAGAVPAQPCCCAASVHVSAGAATAATGAAPQAAAAALGLTGICKSAVEVGASSCAADVTREQDSSENTQVATRAEAAECQLKCCCRQRANV